MRFNNKKGCGHCKTLAPTYELVAKAFSVESNVVLAKVDADKFKELGERYGVTGYPTLKLFTKGQTKPTDFTGGREENSMIAALNEIAGTHRLPGGRLLPEVLHFSFYMFASIDL